MKYFTYILYSVQHDTFYIGQTDAVANRLAKHNRGEVASTERYAPWSLCLSVEKQSRSEAVILERKLKNLNRTRLIAFIKKYGGELPIN